ncbi:hypothetical protein MMAD_43440 [Mycolicibacterium madagascariense]|uniref:DUF3761 domain-containing protein n=1 Tax=Mycolicibacterium madagascariense TaxID=212765 RepID=A0A7I7XLD3_9MYCO|nr:DUF3761 domain-containing protein [Mycolicibacterium madagascariense]MCV7012374.1 DUF3761 domain-containing protein [Mycolicibacterium madagascariense]BBZ30049.1 hypothetical protein MMAD_43440 [Mycolicibacterium madagascariense]
MRVRAGLFALIFAGSLIGLVQAASAPATVIACGGGTYENSDGICIPDPSAPGGGGSDGGAIPAGVTAVCRDGDYSYSTHHSGTCSGHGGVSQWVTS